MTFGRSELIGDEMTMGRSDRKSLKKLRAKTELDVSKIYLSFIDLRKQT